MKKIILLTIWFTLLFPVFMVQGQGERWEHILTNDYFVYSFDKLSFKYTVPAGSKERCLDVWLKYQYRELAISELLTQAKQRNIPEADVKYTENLDYMLVHALLSKNGEKLELETIAYDKNGMPLRLDPACGEWQAVVPGSVNEYILAKVWEYAAGHNSWFKNRI
jgi:hypothetical protein